MSTKKYLSLDGLTEYDALIKQEITNSINKKADKSHTHTASAVGAVATGDVATVSEVETYLGI